MILEQSPPESLQVFLSKAHRHNFGENRMLLKISRCKLCFVGCVGGGSVLLSSSHCKRIPQSRCLPDVKLTFSILLLCNCEDDSYLEYHASDQHKDSLQFVEKQVMVFLHMLTADSLPISRALCRNNAPWAPSGLLSHSCLLMPALLRASCWNLVIFQNSQTTTTGSS